MLIFNQLDTKESSFSKSFDAYLAERNEVSGEVSQLVAEIILKIRSEGDDALKDLTKEFDGFDSDVFKEFSTSFIVSNGIFLSLWEYKSEA